MIGGSSDMSHVSTVRDVSVDSDNPLKDALDNQCFAWNEKVWRERVVAFAKLATKKNVGSQTIERAFRRQVETQVYLPVEHDTNTGIVKASNSEIRKRFLAGMKVPVQGGFQTHEVTFEAM